MIAFNQRVEELLGPIEWITETRGNCECPGKSLHTTPTEPGHCSVITAFDDASGEPVAPGVYCFHDSCGDETRRVSHELRKMIRKSPPSSRSSYKIKRELPAADLIEQFCATQVSIEDLEAQSAVKIPSIPTDQSIVTLETMYEHTDAVSIVLESSSGSPQNSGESKLARGWIEQWRKSPPQWQAGGAWIRPNPSTGSADADVTRFRNTLLEFDNVPLELQLRLYARLPLPICLIAYSGGKSVHAWVRIDANDSQEYKEHTNRLFKLLKPFGIDQSNKNAGRLGRLPGAVRKIKAQGDGIQRLIYLNPQPDVGPIL